MPYYNSPAITKPIASAAGRLVADYVLTQYLKKGPTKIKASDIAKALSLPDLEVISELSKLPILSCLGTTSTNDMAEIEIKGLTLEYEPAVNLFTENAGGKKTSKANEQPAVRPENDPAQLIVIDSAAQVLNGEQYDIALLQRQDGQGQTFLRVHKGNLPIIEDKGFDDPSAAILWWEEYTTQLTGGENPVVALLKQSQEPIHVTELAYYQTCDYLNGRDEGFVHSDESPSSDDDGSYCRFVAGSSYGAFIYDSRYESPFETQLDPVDPADFEACAQWIMAAESGGTVPSASGPIQFTCVSGRTMGLLRTEMEPMDAPWSQMTFQIGDRFVLWQPGWPDFYEAMTASVSEGGPTPALEVVEGQGAEEESAAPAPAKKKGKKKAQDVHPHEIVQEAPGDIVSVTAGLEATPNTIEAGWSHTFESDNGDEVTATLVDFLPGETMQFKYSGPVSEAGELIMAHAKARLEERGLTNYLEEFGRRKARLYRELGTGNQEQRGA